MSFSCPECGGWKPLLRSVCTTCNLRPKWDLLADNTKERLNKGMWPIALLIIGCYLFSSLLAVIFLPLGITACILSLVLPIYWEGKIRMYRAVYGRYPDGGIMMVILSIIAGLIIGGFVVALVLMIGFGIRVFS